ncbi:MAG TPA: AraC family transcriptional regulator [Bacillota bacterium]|nr:AraC family transcriptional regulator [Bacillota bacterium]
MMEPILVVKDSFTPDFFISYIISYADKTKSAHYHDSLEIYLALSDGYRFVVNNKVYPLEKGDIFVFNQADIHHTIITYEKPREVYVIHFMPQYIRDLSTPQTNLLQCFTDRGPDFSHRAHLEPKQGEELTALFDKAIYIYENKGSGHDVYQKILLAEILLWVNSYFHRSETTNRPNQAYESGKIGPILDYINLHFNEEISLELLAQKFYLSKVHLGNIFKTATGYTVKEYIIARRMMFAKQLLLENEPIAKVMEKVGYNNYSHFIRAFKRHEGVTPKNYRKEG